MTYTRISDWLLTDEGVRGARARHPSTPKPRATVRVGTYPDGSQVLLERMEDGRCYASRRASPDHMWGEPVELEEED